MSTRCLLGIALLILLAPLATAAQADVEVANIFSDHMVLQREKGLPVWGRAAAGEKVRVTFAGAKAETTADAQGRWRVDLPARPAGGPYKLIVKGAKTSITVKDVLVGEVWLCGGQSNMEWPVRAVADAAKEMKRAKHSKIRQFTVPHIVSPTANEDVPGSWTVCTPKSVGTFTACGYFMAVKLQKELKVPIGLISSNWGGTRIEPWIPPIGFDGVPSLTGIAADVARRSPSHPDHKAAAEKFAENIATWDTQAEQAKAAGKPVPPRPKKPAILIPPKGNRAPVMLYNAMLHGLVGYALRGAIWYQGESNNGEGALYADKMRALIEGWRKLWGQGDFPFYFVQLAPFRYGKQDPHVLPEMWAAQASVERDIASTGMVVINDIATIDNIHPPNKQDVGLRLANMALKRTYAQPRIVDTGATFKSLAIQDSTLRVTFENVEGGLKWRDRKPGPHFEIRGVGSGWKTANAKIERDVVVLSHPEVTAPAAMRFAWHKLAEPNLVNGAGLPTGAFRAGEVPRPDALPHIIEAKKYTLALDLDLKRLGRGFTYNEDHRARTTDKLARIAYLLELEAGDGAAKYVWVSMDAFTQDLGKIGVPTVASGAHFAIKVANLNVVSNVPGVTAGSGLAGGNIEFWPNNYGPQNTAEVPGAAADLYDSVDSPGPPADGYGCMQIHNHTAQQTLLAINRWTDAGRADLGIGNSTGRSRDWTFTGNGSSYASARLRVFILTK